MGNPLFSGNSMPPMGGPFGNMMNLLNQFNQFKNNFRGNPKEQVQQLLNSGQMTQEQLNQLQNMAKQLQGFLK